ncbi:hypothetical protein BDZ45DRAFT_741834 [Acephala macrosclerotiorum]|nr:hypothetical protein BDZ45DRAFT_741834 [Acephala macrosclerotiorum]
MSFLWQFTDVMELDPDFSSCRNLNFCGESGEGRLGMSVDTTLVPCCTRSGLRQVDGSIQEKIKVADALHDYANSKKLLYPFRVIITLPERHNRVSAMLRNMKRPTLYLCVVFSALLTMESFVVADSWPNFTSFNYAAGSCSVAPLSVKGAFGNGNTLVIPSFNLNFNITIGDDVMMATVVKILPAQGQEKIVGLSDSNYEFFRILEDNLQISVVATVSETVTHTYSQNSFYQTNFATPFTAGTPSTTPTRTTSETSTPSAHRPAHTYTRAHQTKPVHSPSWILEILGNIDQYKDGSAGDARQTEVYKMRRWILTVALESGFSIESQLGLHRLACQINFIQVANNATRDRVNLGVEAGAERLQLRRASEILKRAHGSSQVVTSMLSIISKVPTSIYSARTLVYADLLRMPSSCADCLPSSRPEDKLQLRAIPWLKAINELYPQYTMAEHFQAPLPSKADPAIHTGMLSHSRHSIGSKYTFVKYVAMHLVSFLQASNDDALSGKRIGRNFIEHYNATHTEVEFSVMFRKQGNKDSGKFETTTIVPSRRKKAIHIPLYAAIGLKVVSSHSVGRGLNPATRTKYHKDSKHGGQVLAVDIHSDEGMLPSAASGKRPQKTGKMTNEDDQKHEQAKTKSWISILKIGHGVGNESLSKSKLKTSRP